MTAELLYGKPIVAAIKARMAGEIAALRARGIAPSVAAIHCPASGAARLYGKMQKSLCDEMGIAYATREIDATFGEERIASIIRELNDDPAVTGITLHMPLPDDIDANRLTVIIDPRKDIEGTHPHNMGMLAYGYHDPSPCAARAAVELLRSVAPSLKGREIVIVGHSVIVGKPIALLLLQSKLDAPTPTVCHIATRDLAFHTRRADVLFVAAGKAGLIRADMIKPGAVVIDIGINKQGDKIVGDVAFDEAREVCAYLSPVPGGVGPVTMAMLLQNIVACAKMRQI